MYNILLVEDHEMIRDAIKNYFNESDDFNLADEAENGLIALEYLAKKSYDLILTDINMPKMDGVELLKKLNEMGSAHKTLVLSMHNESIHIKNMIELGANGYVLKNVTKTELFTAMSQIISGEDYFSKEVYDTLIRNISKRKPKERLTKETPISSREQEILVMIANEMTNQEIADKLFISIRTVETHKRNLLEKTGCKNVAGLVMYAVEREIV